MIKQFVVHFFMILFVLKTVGQQVQLKAKLIDGPPQGASDFIFRVTVTNIAFDKYLIQDTTLLKALLKTPNEHLLRVYVEQKKDGKYLPYERFIRNNGGAGTRVECLDSCCNCLILTKGESLFMDVQLLRSYVFEKGSYRLQVGLVPPLMSSSGDKLKEFASKYVYFSVTK
jgi:hypothetical protein